MQFLDDDLDIKPDEFSAKLQKVRGTHPPPSRRPNSEVRPREYLTLQEIKAMTVAAMNRGRNGWRDSFVIRTLFRHAFRASELVSLTWNQIDFDNGHMHVIRRKSGKPSVHTLQPEERRAFMRLKKQSNGSRFVFLSELGAPMTERTVHHIVAEAGKAAGIKFPVHPHMLRHSKGYQLVNDGRDIRTIQDYFGHRQLNQTARYTEVDYRSIADFGKDW